MSKFLFAVLTATLTFSVIATAAPGDLKWRFDANWWVYSSPAIGPDGSIYFGSYDYRLYAISHSGNLKWRYKTDGQVNSSPAIDLDGTVYVESMDGYLYAISPQGNLKWRYETGGSVSSPAIGQDGTVYSGSNSGYLYAISPQGNLKWRYPVGVGMESSPAVGSDGTIYISSCAFNTDGSLQWAYNSGGAYSSPAIDLDGTMYIIAGSGVFFAIESSSKGLAASPWPKFRHDNRNTGRYSPGVWATTIVAPQETASIHGITPVAYFKNTNVEPAKDFYCHCEIWPTYSDTSPLLSPPYHCEYWISYELNPDDSVLVKFSPWQSDDSSTYSARFYATDVFSTTRTVDFRGSVGISEPPSETPSSPVTPVTHHLEISSPINSEIVLRYCLSQGEQGSIKLLDASGRMVESLSIQGQGEAKVAGLSAGIYFARLEAGGVGVTQKVVILR